MRMSGFSIGGTAIRFIPILLLAPFAGNVHGQSTPQVQKLSTPLTVEVLGRKPLNQYGSLEQTIQALRSHRPQDLNAERWRKAHPDGSHAQWSELARTCVKQGLHYDSGPMDLQAKTLE